MRTSPLPFGLALLVVSACSDDTQSGGDDATDESGATQTTGDDGGADGGGDSSGSGTSGAESTSGSSATDSSAETGTETGATSVGTGTGDLLVLSPNGGEDWRNGRVEEIGWMSTAGGTVDIELWQGGGHVADIAVGEDNDGSYDWSIPGAIANAADYRVVVTDANSSDESDADFSVSAWRWVTEVDLTNRSSMAYADKSLVVELTDSTFDYAHANADGSDLRFATSPDQGAGFDVPYYVQEWNPGGTSYVWVGMASLPGSATTTIHMFTGNEIATSDEEFDAVFPSSFVSAGGEVLTGAQQLNYFEVGAGHTVTIDNNAEISADAIVIHGTLDGTGGGPNGGVGGDETTTGTDGQGSAPGTVGLFCGGGGGGHAGVGGDGGRDNTEAGGQGGGTYGTGAVSSSAAPGSGGGGGDNNMLSNVVGGAGGAGGASVALLDSGRVWIRGEVLVNGGAGEAADAAGGGGSGGKISIQAAYLTIEGMLSAVGGVGGDGTTAAADGGGGGGGGRIAIEHEHAPVPVIADIVRDVGGGLAGAAAAAGLDGAGGSFDSTVVMLATVTSVGTEAPVVFP